MISKERFIERVKREVFPQLLGTEKERIKVLCRGIFWIILGFAVLSLFLPLENYEDKDKVDIYKKIIIIVYLFLLYRAARIWDPFIREQKRKFSPTFLNFLEHLRYGQDDIDKDLL